jgi:hypothetical protein
MAFVPGDEHYWIALDANNNELGRSTTTTYEQLPRADVAKFQIANGAGDVVYSASPGPNQLSTNLIYRRRTELGTGPRRVYFIVGFPSTTTDSLTILDAANNSTSTIPAADVELLPFESGLS